MVFPVLGFLRMCSPNTPCHVRFFSLRAKRGGEIELGCEVRCKRICKTTLIVLRREDGVNEVSTDPSLLALSLVCALSPASREPLPLIWRIFFTPTIDTILVRPFRAVCLDLKVPTPLDVLQPYQMIVNFIGIRVRGRFVHDQTGGGAAILGVRNRCSGCALPMALFATLLRPPNRPQ